MTSDPREEKLPRWARQLLAVERHRAATAERRLAEHVETVEPTRIWYGDWQNPVYLPERFGYQSVSFNMNGKVGNKHTFDTITVCLRRDGEFEVQGGHAIHLHPVASNLVHITMEDR